MYPVVLIGRIRNRFYWFTLFFIFQSVYNIDNTSVGADLKLRLLVAVFDFAISQSKQPVTLELTLESAIAHGWLLNAEGLLSLSFVLLSQF
jgi:hypothetical protein